MKIKFVFQMNYSPELLCYPHKKRRDLHNKKNGDSLKQNFFMFSSLHDKPDNKLNQRKKTDLNYTLACVTVSWDNRIVACIITPSISGHRISFT